MVSAMIRSLTGDVLVPKRSSEPAGEVLEFNVTLEQRRVATPKRDRPARIRVAFYGCLLEVSSQVYRELGIRKLILVQEGLPEWSGSRPREGLKGKTHKTRGREPNDVVEYLRYGAYQIAA